MESKGLIIAHTIMRDVDIVCSEAREKNKE